MGSDTPKAGSTDAEGDNARERPAAGGKRPIQIHENAFLLVGGFAHLGLVVCNSLLDENVNFDAAVQCADFSLERNC